MCGKIFAFASLWYHLQLVLQEASIQRNLKAQTVGLRRMTSPQYMIHLKQCFNDIRAKQRVAIIQMRSGALNSDVNGSIRINHLA